LPFSFRAWLARTSLAARLVLTFEAVILVTIAAGAIPAYALFVDELERQLWDRAEAGGAMLQGLLTDQETRVESLVATLAERPTLSALLANEDRPRLQAYLDDFRRGVGLDLLLIKDTAGAVLAASGSDVSINRTVYPAGGFGWSDGPGTDILLLATQDAGPAEFLVTGAIALDRDFTLHVAETTGMEFSLLFEDRRLTSSLEASESVVEARENRGTALVGGWERVEIVAPSGRYVAVVIPLTDESGATLAFAEVSLPEETLAAAQRRWLTSLGAGGLILTLGGMVLAGWVSQRLTHPLRQLTRAALTMSAGDLDAPVPVPEDPPEIRTLARSLEESRVHLQENLGRLKRQKDWSDTLLRSIVEGIVTIDAQGKATSFSAAAERITGWRAEEVVGRRIDDVFRTADGDPFSEEIPHPRGKRSVRVLHRTGRPLTLATTAASVGSPDGGAAQVALVLRDITEEESVQSLRSYFLANISHEFRTPLSAINASVELLLEDLETISKGELAELLDSIYRSVTGLQTLIDNLLESLSIEAGRFTVRRRPADLPAVIEEAARVMRPLLNRRSQALACEIPEGLTPLWIDPMRITQVLVNLLSNASKYSPVQVPIQLQVLAPEGQRIRVTVADRGEGIPRAERENLFRRFVRLSIAETPQYGVGLGLSVVKAIIEEHGGEVGVDERPGGGSIFWFTLPLERGRE
jgi:two-component system sensor histidine kinase ResE